MKHKCQTQHITCGTEKVVGDNIKMDLRDIDCDDVNWIELV